MTLSWTNYGKEENHTVIYCTEGVLSLGVDPDYGIVVDYRNGDREFHKIGAISTNTNWVKSGVIDSFTRNILQSKPPQVDGQRAIDRWT